MMFGRKESDISLMVSAFSMKLCEEFVKCHHCEKDVHSACIPPVDHIWKNLPFTCDSCMTKLGLHKTRKFCASELPGNVLSNQLEKCINDFLQSNGAGDERITIRSFLHDVDTSWRIGTKRCVT